MCFIKQNHSDGLEKQRFTPPPMSLSGSFLKSLVKSGVKILKRHRGNGGNGVFKIIENSNDDG